MKIGFVEGRVPVPHEVFEVVLLDDHTGKGSTPVVAGLPHGPVAVASISRTDRSRGGETAAAHGREHGPPVETTQPTHSDLMILRPPTIEHGLSPGFIDDLMARSKPVEPPPDIPDERSRNEAAQDRTAPAMANHRRRCVDGDRTGRQDVWRGK